MNTRQPTLQGSALIRALREHSPQSHLLPWDRDLSIKLSSAVVQLELPKVQTPLSDTF